MKKIFPLVCFLVLAGCSSSYRVSDFPTKENFYEDFNNAARNMYLNINMINDSLISVKYGANISNDTLIMTTQIQTEGKKIKLKEIESIKYLGGSYSKPSARIISKNETEYNGENIIVLPDSTLEFKIKKFTYERVPLKRIREISYKNRWLGIPAGFLAGSTLGLYFGFVVGNAMYNKSQSGNDKAAYYFILGTPVGALIGSIIGWLVGYNYTYRFNP